MEKQSTYLLSQSTERLFRAVPQLEEVEGELRYCDWLLSAIWRQLAAIAGPGAARSLFGQALLETRAEWPITEQVKVTETGLDTSALGEAHSQIDCQFWRRACEAVVERCLALTMTISGESLVLSVIDRAEAEMHGLSAWLAAGPMPLGASEQAPEAEDENR